MRPTDRLPRQIFAAALLAATTLPAPAQAPDRPAAAPVAAFPTFVHDFGDVVRGDVLRHSFVVRNDGDAPLEIVSVHPT